jgi:hypothetical protein
VDRGCEQQGRHGEGPSRRCPHARFLESLTGLRSVAEQIAEDLAALAHGVALGLAGGASTGVGGGGGGGVALPTPGVPGVPAGAAATLAQMG